MNDNLQIPNEEVHRPSVIRWINYCALSSQDDIEQYLIQQSLKLVTLEIVTGQKVASELN